MTFSSGNRAECKQSFLQGSILRHPAFSVVSHGVTDTKQLVNPEQTSRSGAQPHGARSKNEGSRRGGGHSLLALDDDRAEIESSVPLVLRGLADREERSTVYRMSLCFSPYYCQWSALSLNTQQ